MQLVIANQLVAGGENFAVIWQRISNNEPCRPPLAIFQILEKTGIKSISDATRDHRFVQLKGRFEF